MSTRKIKNARDLSTNELIYFKGHAKATYLSDGVTVEDAINNLRVDSNDISMYTQEEYNALPIKPNRYLNIDNVQNDVITDNTYTTSSNGTYIDVLFSAVRALQSEISRLKNSFYYGIQSYTGTDTASASIIQNEEQEEKEPLWAVDPEDLSEFTDNSIVIGTDCLLTPVSNLSIQSNYVEIFDQVAQEVDLNFDMSEEAKQCVYITADVKQNSTILLDLDGDASTTLHLQNYLSRSKCNALVIISRKIYDENTEQYFGKNYIWIQVTDSYGNVVNTGYINTDNGSLVQSEFDCGNRYYVKKVRFSGINLYKCNFYSKQSSFTNEDTISSLTPK